MTVKLMAEHHFEFLSLKGGCTGSSESTLVKMSHCWKSHVASQVCYKVTTLYHLMDKHIVAGLMFHKHNFCFLLSQVLLLCPHHKTLPYWMLEEEPRCLRK